MLNPRTVSELLFGSTPELKKVCTEPDLFYMSLMAAFSNDLLHCILLFAFFVLS